MPDQGGGLSHFERAARRRCSAPNGGTASSSFIIELTIQAAHTVQAVAFGTLKFVRILGERANLMPKQVEKMADVTAEVLAESIIAKTDIGDIRIDIEALELARKADIETTQSEIAKWMFGTIEFQTVVVLGAVVARAPSLP